MTKADFAREANVTPAAISIALKAGRIHAEPDGSINPRAKDNAAYLTTAKRQRRAARPRAGGKSGGKASQRHTRSGGHRTSRGKKKAEVPEGGGPLEIDGETYAMAELRKMVEQANKEELNNKVRRGELVERSDVKRVFSRVYAVIASQIKTLGEKLGPDITSALNLPETDTGKVQQIMDEDTRRALTQIKKDLGDYLASLEQELEESPA